MRILDLDLDFFVQGAAHMWDVQVGRRLDPKEYPPWPLEDVFMFLEQQCGLLDKVPGYAVEHHDEVFGRWRAAIQRGELRVPFHVTHVDAHADLGLGDNGYVYLMSELLFQAPNDRQYPSEVGWRGLQEGNYLAFAVGCRWISDIEYVYNEGGGNDIPSSIMENFDPSAEHIELKAVVEDEIMKMLHGREPEVRHREPLVPLKQIPRAAFRANGPYDLLCLSRSPEYTPQASDAIYDQIRRRYIDEGGRSA